MDRISNPLYTGRICEAIEATDSGPWVVRVLGVGTDDAVVKICVRPGTITPVVEEDSDECPICLEPLCDMDDTLLCGHKFHTYCFDKVRSSKKNVSCPTCRSWAGDGGDFKLVWTERSAHEVLISCLAVIHVQRKNKGSTAGAEWAKKRVIVLAKDKTGAADILETLIREHANAITVSKAANGKPFDARTFCRALVTAIARALPSSAWEPEFRRLLDSLMPGRNAWAHVGGVLRTELEREL